MKKVTGLLVMDVDGNLIRQEGIDLLAQEAGAGEKVAEITAQAMNGELDFSASLEARVALLKGLEISAFQKILKQIEITQGAEGLITELHQRGYKVGLVSGGFHEVIDPIARSLGIDLVRANRLQTFDGRLTGKVLGEIVTPERKKDSLLTWAKENHVPRSQTIAMGDGANDLPMIETAGIGIAFMAKPIVAERAPYRIQTRDLSLVLEILDQHRKETACISY
ncbi:Phosphoserine phosphatase [Streptococcus parasanguinis]|uniref:phosphoserine phosphatase SerB n=1 Tax=Streptococcus parasanguinis TaxID=1318 RepID=UPI001960F7E7|nr:phosphoserine phosphatase SerB [Streptococcus parasanguinis]VTY20567.1 Phosphoserine phosphatase [Streptococcus parasanguinis]